MSASAAPSYSPEMAKAIHKAWRKSCLAPSDDDLYKEWEYQAQRGPAAVGAARKGDADEQQDSEPCTSSLPPMVGPPSEPSSQPAAPAPQVETEGHLERVVRSRLCHSRHRALPLRIPPRLVQGVVQ